MKKTFLFLVVLTFTLSANAAYDVFEVENAGLKAWYLQDDALPIVSIQLAFDRSGYAYDPKGKEGASYLVASMLNEGAGRMGAKKFQKLLDENAIQFSPRIDEDYFYISIKTISQHLPLALEMVNASITKPRFGADELETVRGQTVSYIEKKKENSSKMALQALSEHIYRGHPYSNPKEGTVEIVEKLTAEDLKTFVKEHFTKENLKVAIAGNVSKMRAKQILKMLAMNMPEKSTIKDIPEFTVYPKGGHKNVKIDNPQTVVMFVSEGISRADKDFYSAYVLNHIIGGSGFQSVLYSEVREKKGLSYYIGTSMSVSDKSHLFIGSMATANDQVHEAKETVRQALREVEADGITQEQLDSAKSYITGSFPLNLDKNSKIANYLLMMQQNDLGPNYLKDRNTLINSVTLEQINKTAKKLISAENLTFLTVGK